MRRFKALPGIRDALTINCKAPRHVRILSTALCRTPHSMTSPLPTRPQFQPRPQLLLSSHRHASSSTSSVDPPTTELRQTPLHALHLSHSAKMVPFGGYHMPVSYGSHSVGASHYFTRTHASLFDVSHMVQHRISKPSAVDFLQKITPADLHSLKVHKSTLSTMLWPSGGIVDDLMITRLEGEEWYMVTNAGCREKDKKFIKEELEKFLKEDAGREVKWEVLDGWGLIALQGPLSVEILEGVLAEPTKVDFNTLYFGESQYMRIKFLDGKISSPMLVSRGGYTGEDGFEISIPPNETVAVTESLLQTAGPERLKLAGLGARDCLRLEAGMCLYGHDLDDTTTPVEAGLSWLISPERRRESAAFNGADVILPQLKPKSQGGKGVERRRVGLIGEGAPAREGAELFNEKGEKVGVVTSGCPSPTLERNVAMAYVRDGDHKAETELDVVVRGKKRKWKVVKMPFVPAKYFKAPA